jgi:hypothetical protein
VINNGRRNDTSWKQGLLCKSLLTSKQNNIKSREDKSVLTLIRPVATYRAETWTLTVVEGNALRMFTGKNYTQNIWNSDGK